MPENTKSYWQTHSLKSLRTHGVTNYSATTFFVAEHLGCWGSDGYSERRFSFDSVGVYEPQAWAYNDCGWDYDYARFYVADMGFSILSSFIPVNDDDDDGNGRMDNHNEGPLPAADNDLVPCEISVHAPSGTRDTVTLSLYHDYFAVQVWDDATRDGLLITDTDVSESWYAGTWSRTVYVEGMRASGGTPSSDPKLHWDYFGQDAHPLHGWNGQPPSEKRLIVVRVDVDMDGVTDDHYTYPGITEETTPGGFVPLDDFVELTVKQMHPVLTDPPNWPGVTLSVTYLGDGRVRVWNSSKTQVITLPHTLSPTQDTTFWVEGHQTSSDPCDTQLSLTHSTTGFKDTIHLTVFDVEVVAVGFTGDHLITRWSDHTTIDDPDGSAAVWIDGGTNHPVCYTKNSLPALFAGFTVSPEILGPGIDNVSVRARIESTIIGSASGCRIVGTAVEDGSNTDGDVDGIGGGSPVPDSNAVRTLTPTFTWELSLDGANWVSAGSSGAHTMYWTDSNPVAAPLYDFGLEKACGYVDGSADIGAEINMGIAGEITYDPAAECTHGLDAYTVGYGQCCCHVELFSLLVSHVTCYTPPAIYVWGGCSASHICFYQHGGWLGPSFQCDRNLCEQAPHHPHFAFHVETAHGGVVYDPSYGLTGWPSFLCFAPAVPFVHYSAGSDRYGSGAGLTQHLVPYACGSP